MCHRKKKAIFNDSFHLIGFGCKGPDFAIAPYEGELRAVSCFGDNYTLPEGLSSDEAENYLAGEEKF